MRRGILTLTAVVVLLLACAKPAGAIPYGEPDNWRHPYVGGLVTEFQGQLFLICSGTMISPTAFVTAAHCTSLLESLGLPAYVTFDEAFDPAAPQTLYPGTMVTHPAYDDAAWPYTPDVAVVVLNEDPGVGYASLPEIGLLDGIMAQPGFRKTTLTVVGYGASGYTRGGGPPQQIYLDQRLVATADLRLGQKPAELNGTNLFHTADPGHGGGTCNGDSGGPVFLGGYDSSLLLGVTSGGQNVGFDNVLCTTPHQFAYRLDTAEAHDFLGQFLG